MSPEHGDCGTLRDGVTLGDLYEREHNRVFAVCFAILRNVQDAEDAAQETFARVVAHAGSLVGDPRGYLTTTARNVCIDEMRRRARRQESTVDVATHADAGHTIEDTALARDVAHLAWQRLGDADRRLVAYVFAGLTLGEIAARLQVSAGLVSVRLFRARQRLRRLMPAPAVLATMTHPRLLAQSLLRRLRPAYGDTAGPFLAALHGGAAAVVPAIVGVIAGAFAGGAPSPSVPHVGPGGASAVAPAYRLLDIPATVLRERVAEAQRALATAAPSALPGMPMFTPQFAASPHYEQDHTLFAAEPGGSLYRTGDGGRTWQALGRSVGGQLLIPPAFPASQTLYAMSDGLQRSDDGGRTFKAVRAVVDQAQSGEQQGRSLVDQVVSALPSPLSSALPGADGVFVDPAQVTQPIQGDVAVIDPGSTAGDVRIVVATRQSNNLAVYDNRTDTLTPFVVAPDQLAVEDAFTGAGASGVDVVAQTESQGWSVFSCGDGGTCTRVGAAADVLRAGNLDRVISPTFGADATLWYPLGAAVRQVTLGGADTTLALPPGWDPFAVLPDAHHATTRKVDVIADDVSAPSVYRVLESVNGGAFRVLAGPALPDGVDSANLLRLGDGSIVGTQWDWGSGLTYFVCSADDGTSWRSHC